MTPLQNIKAPDYRVLKRIIRVVVTALILLTAGFSAWKSMTEYRLTVKAADLQSSGYARALREHAERAFSEADSVLMETIDHIRDDGDMNKEDSQHLRAIINRHLHNIPQIGTVFLVNRDGLLFANLLDTPVKQTNVSDRDYFIHHRDHPDDDTPFLSRPFKSRLNGKWRFTISRPVRSISGKFEGLVAAAFEMDYFHNFYGSLDLGKQGKIVIVRKDGVMLLAEPFKEADFSKDFSQSHLIRTHLPKADKGTFHIGGGKALLAPDARIISYDSLKHFPVVATANMGLDEVTGQWRTNTLFQAVLSIVVSLTLWLLTLILLRQLQRIEDAYSVQMEQQIELAASAESWQSTFDAVEDSIWVIDLDRTVLRANKSTERFFRAQLDQIIGCLCCEILLHNNSPLSNCPFQKMIETGHRASIQTIIEDCWYDVSVDPIKNAAGEITGAVHIVSDISTMKQAEVEREQLEMQLRQAQKMEAIGHLAGGIAHDFNNLLTPIMGYAEMAAAAIPHNDPLAQKLAGITAAAHKAKALTQQLLSFGRRKSIVCEVVNLNEVILSFNTILRRTIRESIRIDLVLDPEGSYIKGDHTQIEQIILNMTVNAQDAFDGAQGRITIETCKIVMDGENARMHPGMVPGEYVLLSFRDNGCGMNKEVMNHIFEPFFTTKQVGHGTGLGLATVYGIVKQHEAYISVTSHTGEGTTFNIYFPVCDKAPPMAPQVAPPPDRKVTGEITVLLVEDNDMVREMAQEMLTGYGYTVLAAADPQQAIKLLAHGTVPIDLLVSDVVMPGMNGPELYEQLVEQIPSLKVVFISGYPINPSLRGRTLKDEVNYLQKPFTAEALLERIHQVL